MLNEFRFALRILIKNPAFTLIAIVTLALGIGATTAVFTLVNALLIRPLPYQKPQQLVLLFQHFKDQHLDNIPVSPPEFVDYQQQLRSFDKLAAFNNTTYNLAEGRAPERVAGAVVSADLFPLLGVNPIRGAPLARRNAKPDTMMSSSSASGFGKGNSIATRQFSGGRFWPTARRSPSSASCRQASNFHCRSLT